MGQNSDDEWLKEIMRRYAGLAKAENRLKQAELCQLRREQALTELRTTHPECWSRKSRTMKRSGHVWTMRVVVIKDAACGRCQMAEAKSDGASEMVTSAYRSIFNRRLDIARMEETGEF